MRAACRLTSVVSVGNAVHLGVEDYLAWLGDRPEIGAALLYVESIEDHERFRGVARAVAARKPVIALFGGRTEVGGRAAAAHTGAVANDDAAIDAFCASCGIVRVKSLRRLLVAAKAFGRFPQGLGKRALILSNSGGPGVLCADRAALEGLELGALPKAMAEVLRQQLPPEASVANPIDLLADAREDRFGLAFEAAMNHAAHAYDMVLMIHVVPFMVDAAPVIARLAELAATARLPLLHSMMGTLPGKAEWFATMEAAGVPMFNDVEEMAEAAGLLARYPILRSAAQSARPSPAAFRDRRGLRLKTRSFTKVTGIASGLLHFCHFSLDLWIIRSQYRPRGQGVGRRQGAGEFANSLKRLSFLVQWSVGEADGVHDDARHARRPLANFVRPCCRHRRGFHPPAFLRHGLDRPGQGAQQVPAPGTQANSPRYPGRPAQRQMAVVEH